MRTALAAFVLLAAGGFADSTKADSYPWCAQHSGWPGSIHCWYTSYDQCRATVSGVGGYCVQNPHRAATTDELVRRARKRS